MSAVRVFAHATAAYMPAVRVLLPCLGHLLLLRWGGGVVTRLAKARRSRPRRMRMDALTADRVDTGDITWNGPVPDGIAGYPMGTRRVVAS